MNDRNDRTGSSVLSLEMTVFMGTATMLLASYLRETNLTVWQGDVKRSVPHPWANRPPTQTSTHTIVVSDRDTDWSVHDPDGMSFLQVKVISDYDVCIEVNIGSEKTSCEFSLNAMPAPLVQVLNPANKLAHLDLSVAGSALRTIVSDVITSDAFPSGAYVTSEVCYVEPGSALYRCDVSWGSEGSLMGSFFLDEECCVGVFIPKRKGHPADPAKVQRRYVLNESTGWLDLALVVMEGRWASWQTHVNTDK